MCYCQDLGIIQMTALNLAYKIFIQLTLLEETRLHSSIPSLEDFILQLTDSI